MAFIRYQSSVGKLDIESNTNFVEVDGELGIYFNIADDREMMLNASGNLGIGTLTPAYKLQVAGDADITGELTAASDVRLKMEVLDLEQALTVLSKLAPKSYSFRKSEYPDMDLAEGRKMGFLAQDIETVLPNLVSEGAETTNAIDGQTFQCKSVNYIELIPLLTKAIQEQQAIIERQQTEINAIKEQLTNLN